MISSEIKEKFDLVMSTIVKVRIGNRQVEAVDENDITVYIIFDIGKSLFDYSNECVIDNLSDYVSYDSVYLSLYNLY